MTKHTNRSLQGCNMEKHCLLVVLKYGTDSVKDTAREEIFQKEMFNCTLR